MAFNEDIVGRAKRNTYFREVLATGPHSQVVVMSIPPGGEIGEETHNDVDQILDFVEGEGVAILDGERSGVGPFVHGLRAAGARPGDDPPDEGRSGRGRSAKPVGGDRLSFSGAEIRSCAGRS